MKHSFACGNMVLFLSSSQKIGSESQIFVKKDVHFRPAEDNIHFQGRDRVSRVSE
jgi:hypothetical protein